ncbi:hypothetical protein J1614_008107 [Plenodomus biglobosus]|nr:hypothetical protein J1614_008107 [Plenodomus biglobosus]
MHVLISYSCFCLCFCPFSYLSLAVPKARSLIHIRVNLKPHNAVQTPQPIPQHPMMTTTPRQPLSWRRKRLLKRMTIPRRRTPLHIPTRRAFMARDKQSPPHHTQPHSKRILALPARKVQQLAQTIAVHDNVDVVEFETGACGG